MNDQKANIDFSSYLDAYGPATDLAKDLRGLQAATPRARAAALDRLWGRLCHQGSVYPASAAAVPVLMTIAKSKCPDRHGVIELLAAIAIGDHSNYLGGSLSPARVKKATRTKRGRVETPEDSCYQAVCRRAPGLRALLRDPDDQVRAAAAFALAWLPDPSGTSTRAITSCYRRERDDHARVSMLIALGHLGARESGSMLERAVTDAKAGLPLRAAAAIALVYLDGKKSPESARHVLETACTTRKLEKTAQPWNGGDLAGHAGEVLATLPVRRAGRRDQLSQLKRLGYFAGDKLAGEMVKKAFAGRDTKAAAALTERQGALLEAIVRAGLLRWSGHVAHALQMRGLPKIEDLPAFVGVKAGVHRELRRR